MNWRRVNMKKSINNLKDADIYSLSMFVLYKLIDVKEYSIMGELPYILDKKNLLNFCNYFGGRTIKVPTLNELHSIMYLLLLYQYTKIENIPYEEAIKLIGYRSSELRQVKTAYNNICKVLDQYNFGK
jgi:hypothetical protein